MEAPKVVVAAGMSAEQAVAVADPSLVVLVLKLVVVEEVAGHHPLAVGVEVHPTEGAVVVACLMAVVVAEARWSAAVVVAAVGTISMP